MESLASSNHPDQHQSPAVQGQITRIVYVRENGHPTEGDGSINNPYRQITTAVDSLKKYGPIIYGTVTIDVGEGKFQGGIKIPTTRNLAQDDFIRIIGKKRNGVPTTHVIHSPGTNRGVLAEDGLAIWLQDLKFIGGFPVAVQLTRNVYGWFTNVHADGQGKGARGFSISSHSRYYVKGGLIENMTYAGIDEYFGVTRSLATVTSHVDQMLIRNCRIGLRAKEGCVGHLDYLTVEGCDTGIELLQQSVANCKAVALRRNGTGLAIINSASHNEGGIIWGSGVDANEREVYSAGASGELRALMWAGETMGAKAVTGHRALFNIGNDYTQKTITGQAEQDTLITTFPKVLPVAYFRNIGKHFKLVLLATITGVSPEHPSQVIVRIGMKIFGTVNITTSGTQKIEFDTVCIRDITQHLTSGMVSGAGATSTRVTLASDLLSGDPSAVATVNLYYRPGKVDHELTMHTCELSG